MELDRRKTGMTKEVYQCCYTNDNGWGAVAVSKEIPQQAYTKCTQMQGINSTISSTVDESNNLMNLFEVYGDDRFVYIERTQYGLKDGFGRNNNFAHTYILSWSADQALKDANVFLTIANENFKSTVEEAEELHDLIYLPRFSLEKAMKCSGLNRERYSVLIQCIYAQMFLVKPKRPLYVAYDGTDLQMRALLFCIYTGLPHYMRKLLSASSSPTVSSSERMSIVFTQFPEKYDRYFVPATGKNTILTERYIKNIKNLRYVTYAIENLSLAQEDMESYYTELDRAAMGYGDNTASNSDVLKMAMFIPSEENMGTVSGFTDLELTDRMYDALKVASSYESEEVEKYIARMLEEYCKRDKVLGEVDKNTLNQKLDRAITEELKQAGKKYQMSQFGKLSREELAKSLSQMEKNRRIEYRDALLQSQDGIEKIIFYYLNYALIEGDSWEQLEEIQQEIKGCPSLGKVKEQLEANAFELYEDSIRSNGDVINAYRHYIKIMEAEETENLFMCERTAKQQYWENQTWDTISLNKKKEYDFFKIQDEKSDFVQRYMKLSECDLVNDDWNYLWKSSRLIKKACTVFDLNDMQSIMFQKKLQEDFKIPEEKHHWHKWSTAIFVWEEQEKDKLKDIYEILEHESPKRSTIEKLQSAYKELWNAAEKSRKKQTYDCLFRELRDMVIEYCCVYEERESVSYVPLEFWLMLAKEAQNPFKIFDSLEIEAGVLSADAQDVVNNTNIFEENPKLYQEATQYTGEYEKTIRKWVKIVEKNKKQSKKTNEDDQKEKISFFKKIIKFFSKKEKNLQKEEIESVDEVDFQKPIQKVQERKPVNRNYNRKH